MSNFKDFKDLKLSIPSLDAKECMHILGGDGYNGTFDLPELIVTPEYPDDEDEFYEDDIDDQHDPYDDNDTADHDSHDSYNSEDAHNSDTPNIQEVINSLPESIRNYCNQLISKGLLTGIEFKELTVSGQIIISKDGTCKITLDYDAGNLGEAWWYSGVLTQELFHYFQYQSGIIDRFENHSPIEFQENFMGWMNYGSCGSLLGECSGDFDQWLNDIVNDRVVDYNQFIQGISQWYDEFINTHPNYYGEDSEYGYQDQIPDMNWEEVLEWYGFIIKK